MIAIDIFTPTYLPFIIAVLKRYSLNQSNFVIVPNTLIWAKENGLTGIDQDCVAFSSHSKNVIVFREKMSKEEVNGQILERIDFPSSKRTQYLNTPEKFIEHLVLHEIGHLVKKLLQKDENKADDFAFEEMDIY